MPVAFEATTMRGRQAICLRNDLVAVTITTGGGHIALFQRVADLATAAPDNDYHSPLWVPPWPTFDPAVGAAAPAAIFATDGCAGVSDEARLLSHVHGHHLCLDVFGAHSAGEVAASIRAPGCAPALAFHGEAAQVTWTVDRVECGPAAVTVCFVAHLPRSLLTVTREFSLRHGDPTVKVVETLANLVGFERALGRAQHVTLGAAFLRAGHTIFSSNVDRGLTWPETDDDPTRTYATNTPFDYPFVPAAAADQPPLDWRVYPRNERNSDLCTLRVRPTDRVGWFLAHNRATNLALVYAWDRQTFPWLMTWEENHARTQAPWAGRTLARGLEFSSYAFPLGRRANVARGTLFDTPAFEWLDAHETKSTTFYLSLQSVGAAEDEVALKLEDAKLSAGNLEVHLW